MIINKGLEVEEAMKCWFKGKPHPLGCVDFQTSKTLYEVKSCKLFIYDFNGNNKRTYTNKPHKKIRSNKLGRFSVNFKNHNLLYEQAKKEKKIPKYIFVILIGKQKIWRIKSWNEVGELLNENKDITHIRIKDLFNEY